MRFYYNNNCYNTDAVITANSEALGHPVSNLADQQLAKTYRATDDTSEWVKYDFGAAVDVDSFLLAGHNLTDAATVHIQANATDAWGDPSVDVTLTVRDLIYYHWGSTQSYQWWRITIADAANPDTYIEFGLAFIGEYYQPTYGVYREFTERIVDESVVEYSITGQAFGDKRVKKRQWPFTFRYMTNADKLLMDTMYDAVRGGLPVFFTYDESADPMSIYYAIISAWDPAHVVAYQWKASIELTEAF